jgi:hypothetical protein
MVTNVIFYVQFFLMLFAIIMQAAKMFKSTQGVTTSWALFSDIYFGILLWQSIIAQSAMPSPALRQIIIMYLLATAGYFVMLVLVLIKAPKSKKWDINDWRSSGVVVIGGVLVIALSFPLGWGIAHPIVKALMAVFLKAFPQVGMARKIWQVGGKGLAATAVISLNVPNLLRISLVSIDAINSGWDINRWPILLAEALNAISWFGVTIALLKDKLIVRRVQSVS